MVHKKIRRIIGCLLLLGAHYSCAMNLLHRPYNSLLRPPYTPGKRFNFALFGEHGLSTKGFDSNGCSVDIMRIWNTDQNALKMLEGFPAGSPQGELNVKLDANDDGVRGHFCVNGDLRVDAALLYAHYAFDHDWFVSVYLPIYRMELKDVVWCEQTKDVDAQDFIVKDCLTNDFFNNVCKLGNGLSLCGWDRKGVGDLTFLLQWQRNFHQMRSSLRNVQLNFRLGTNIPTGLREDEDKILAFPFGYNGAMGVLFGGGLEVSLGRYFKYGLDVELLHLFGNTRCRRIKTHRDQTELLLLKKTDVYKDWGLTQQFNLHILGHHKGFKLLLGYQYRRHADDFLSVVCEDSSDEIANTAVSLQDWTMHHGIVNASYSPEWDPDRAKPYISLYARIPFNGKRTVLETMIGGVIGVEF